MSKPLLLDLFCGAGGCSVGYHRAGFDVIGCDIAPSKRYPFTCWSDDAMVVLDRLSCGKTHRGFKQRDFAAIHASPPCQMFSTATFCRPGIKHQDLLRPTLAALQQFDCPWVVENVEFSPTGPAIVLCGLMFGLKVFRHRRFASNVFLWSPEHRSHRGHRIGVNGMVCIAGHGSASSEIRKRTPADHRDKAAWQRASGIDWMTRDELSQALPPAYTEFLGRQLLTVM